ncbi:carboxyl transferase domain-containing protein [Nocardioides sp.]|uniref:carboxyl transferase domain-containing protein n=1 Tax=Nocardioides sp. TaxID=35761 RepID=UPI0039E65FC5
MAHLTARDLLDLVLDEGSWLSWDTPPARAGVSAEYAAELAAAQARSGAEESVLTGEGRLGGRRVAVLVSEFGFLAGSVGRDAADRLVNAIQRATRERLPLVGAPASGGTRMQEGTPAFVQMVRIGEAISAHKTAGLPYLVYLRHPTTGGVMATWGSLGHVTIAEPRALLGFLGPKVVELVTGAPLPPDVQQAENLRMHGIIDAVVLPTDLRTVALNALDVIYAPRDTPARALPEDRLEAPDAWDAITRTRRPDRPGVRELLGAAEVVVPLFGSGRGEHDRGIRLALARFGAAPCVLVAQDRRSQAERPFGPEGLRVAQRGFELASALSLPVVTVIDTRGAALSAAAENGAIAGEIARTLAALLGVGTPTVSLMLGEGSGGGALAFLPADRIVAAQHAWLTPLPPEGASAIVHGDTTHAADMARTQRIGAFDLRELGVVDRIVAERPDAADEPDDFVRRVAAVLEAELLGLLAAGPGTPADRASRYA